jgi:hypothetical protein
MATRRLVMARVGERWVRAGIGAAVAMAAVTLAAPMRADAGGGDWLYPDRDRYEPGQRVAVVGYVLGYAYCPGELDHAWRSRGPFYAYLRVARRLPPAACPYVRSGDSRVGELLIEERAGVPSSETLRVAATFTLPPELAPGAYEIVVCNDPCTIGLGELLESTVYVGVDPPEPIVRDWPLDEPLIRYLDDGAMLSDPLGGTITAAEVRAGYRPTPVTVPVTVPPRPEPAAPTTTDPPAGRPVAGAGESPAGTAGTDPAGGVPSEIVAWVTGFGVLLVVWCLAWRWRPRGARMVVRQGNGQHDHGSSDDDPNTVHIKL